MNDYPYNRNFSNNRNDRRMGNFQGPPGNDRQRRPGALHRGIGNLNQRKFFEPNARNNFGGNVGSWKCNDSSANLSRFGNDQRYGRKFGNEQVFMQEHSEENMDLQSRREGQDLVESSMTPASPEMYTTKVENKPEGKLSTPMTRPVTLEIPSRACQSTM